VLFYAHDWQPPVALNHWFGLQFCCPTGKRLGGSGGGGGGVVAEAFVLFAVVWP